MERDGYVWSVTYQMGIFLDDVGHMGYLTTFRKLGDFFAPGSTVPEAISKAALIAKLEAE